MGGKREVIYGYLLRDVYKCQPLNHTEEQYDETIWKDFPCITVAETQPVMIKNNGIDPAILCNLPRNAGVSIRHNNI